MRSRRAATAVAVAVAALAILALARPAAAQAGESIDGYTVALDISADGVLHVTETILYSFGGEPRHGIQRRVPVRFHFDGRYDRLYPLHDIRVETDPGTPDQISTTTVGRDEVIRIGDPDRVITGPHRYTLRYDVAGALNSFEDHDELYWNAIGTEWTVGIASPRVTVTTPGTITQVACFAGPEGSRLPCDSTDAGPRGTMGTFAHSPLQPGEALTVVVGLTKGAVPEPRPVLDERFSLARAFAVTPATTAGAGALALVGLALVAHLAWFRGRDRRSSGDGLVPVFEDREGPVAFRPPGGMRPAQMGLLIDEVAHPLDITATIVDLAVRGYLRIEELEREHFWSRRDWRLLGLKEGDGGLLPYEATLLRALFRKGADIELSSLRNRFSADLRRVQEQLYIDAVHQGWFAERPDKVRARWLGIAIAVVAVGIGLTVALVVRTHAALLGPAVIVVGIALFAVRNHIPARSAQGSQALRDALGFRKYLETAEVERMRFAEEENLLATYLPYAIVFGATAKWAKAFDGLDEAGRAAAASWYGSPHGFQAGAFASSMASFTDRTGAIVVSTPSSSGSSGFSGGGSSGGGGGGGGGGSW
ncbi:MAG: DUF2207 domain-containing protein [Acidimicrobiales bacterium]